MSPVERRPGRRRHEGRVHPLVISVVTIVAIAFVIFYAFNQGLPFQHRFTLHALVNNSVNLRAGAPVRIAGIDVGQVTGVSPAGRASEVTFTMSGNGLPVHRDATVRVRDRLFLEGAYYLELDPGSPEAASAVDGFTIPQSQTRSPVQFYQFLSTFNSQARSSLQHVLQTLNQGFSPQPGQSPANSGAGSLKGAIPALTPVLRDVAWVTRALRGTTPGDVGTLLNGSSRVTATLAASESQLTGLVHNLNVASAALAASDGALGASISELDRTVQAAPPSLVAIDRALPPLTRLAAVLDPSLRVAPPIVDSVSAAVAQLARVVAPTGRRRLLTTLDATFVQFPSILRLLASAFPVTKLATDCLRTHVTPMLLRQVPDGQLSTGRPVWQDFVHFLPTIAGSSAGFDANGPYVRALFGAGTNSLSGSLLSTTLLGQLLGSSPTPGGGAVLGARPQWVGDLPPSAFRPDVPCTSQPLPSLAAPTAAADLRGGRR